MSFLFFIQWQKWASIINWRHRRKFARCLLELLDPSPIISIVYRGPHIFFGGGLMFIFSMLMRETELKNRKMIWGGKDSRQAPPLCCQWSHHIKWIPSNFTDLHPKSDQTNVWRITYSHQAQQTYLRHILLTGQQLLSRNYEAEQQFTADNLTI